MKDFIIAVSIRNCHTRRAKIDRMSSQIAKQGDVI
jgi:hypothetical protein